jgi:hypothetical protein
MLRFFDYMQYRVCEFYLKHRGTSPEGTAIIIVALMQFLNIFSIYNLLSIITQKKLSVGKGTVLAVIVLLLFLNGWRYYKFDYGMLKKKWAEPGEQDKTRRGYWIILYIIVSIALCIGLTVYVGSNKSWK